MKLETGLAWGVALFAMIAMTDIPATATIAAALAWLIFVAVLMTFGPQAFSTITSVYTTPTRPPGSGGGGLGKQP